LPTFIGLDVGGTTLKAARIDGKDRIEAQLALPAGGSISRDELARRISHCVRELSRNGSPQAVGLCFGGLLQDDGTMREGSTNLANLDKVPLKEFFTRLLGLPCKVENDAIAAMRGEATFGAARGLRNAMTMTFGSGIGSRLLLNGRIHYGTRRRAGEIGVWRLGSPDANGNCLSLEDLAAPARFFRRHGVELSKLLAKELEDGPGRIEAESAIESVGRAIANAHLLLDLEAVVLAGGITALGGSFLHPIRAAYEAACPVEYRHGMDIRIGELGPYSGAAGAAALCFEDSAA
jgi:glucokinase